MNESQLLKLFDSYWYETPILGNKSSAAPAIKDPPLSQSQAEEEALVDEPKLLRGPTIHVRSLSDQHLVSNSSLYALSLSPDSTPKLQTVFSEKEMTGLPDVTTRKQEANQTCMKKKVVRGRRGRRTRTSRSLSELEFEELKGFMDLGFVFAEEDAEKKSGLLSLIPGLQRLGRKIGVDDDEQEGKNYIDDTSISRPYLSEAWDVMDQRKVENQPLKWSLANISNEIDMKDHLRFWAHKVASTVR